MKWINVKEKSPKEGEIIVAWLSKKKEPACVRFERDNFGPKYIELVEVDRFHLREDIITHWLPLPQFPEKK